MKRMLGRDSAAAITPNQHVARMSSTIRFIFLSSPLQHLHPFIFW
jgi:hypothetical protein